METHRSIVTAARKCDLRPYKYRLLPLHGFAVFDGRRRGLSERFGLDRTDSVAFGVSERTDRIDTTTVVTVKEAIAVANLAEAMLDRNEFTVSTSAVLQLVSRSNCSAY